MLGTICRTQDSRFGFPRSAPFQVLWEKPNHNRRPRSCCVFWRTAAGVAHWNACWPAKRWSVAWLRSCTIFCAENSCGPPLMLLEWRSPLFLASQSDDTPWLIRGHPQKVSISDHDLGSYNGMPPMISLLVRRHQEPRGLPYLGYIPLNHHLNHHIKPPLNHHKSPLSQVAWLRLCRLWGPVWKCQTDECPRLWAGRVSWLGTFHGFPAESGGSTLKGQLQDALIGTTMTKSNENGFV